LINAGLDFPIFATVTQVPITARLAAISIQPFVFDPSHSAERGKLALVLNLAGFAHS
jgi:hypothetical protein